MALFAVLVFPIRSAIVDDTYIHLQYARNLAALHELSFNQGEPSYGATSPLWVFVLSIVSLAGGNLMLWSKLLSVGFAVLTILLVYFVADELTRSRFIAFLAAIVMASEAWFVRWSAVGMETAFSAFMVLIVFFVFFRRFESRGFGVLLAVVFLLSTLSRPEVLLLFPLAVFTEAHVYRSIRSTAKWSMLFVIFFILWLLVIHHHTGSYFPLTAGAKQGRFALAGIVARSLVPIKILGATLLLPWLAVISSIVLGILRGDWSLVLRSALPESLRDERRMKAFVELAVLWIFSLPVVYVVMDFQLLSRYLVPTIPLVVLLGVFGFFGLARLLSGRRSSQRIIAGILVLLTIVQSVVFFKTVVVKPTLELTDGINKVLVPFGRWIDKNTNREAVIAAPDIGAIGYFSHRRILDLGGLVSREINTIRRRVDYETILDKGLYLRFNPDFLVDRSPKPERFADKKIGSSRFTPILEGTIKSLGIRKQTPMVYVLYRIERGTNSQISPSP